MCFAFWAVSHGQVINIVASHFDSHGVINRSVCVMEVLSSPHKADYIL